MGGQSLQLIGAVVLFSITVATLAGCGDGKRGESSLVTSVPSVSSRQCISCHEANKELIVSKISGVKIMEQWRLSAHNTAEGAGCVDCHGYHAKYITPANCRDCHADFHLKHGQMQNCSDCHGGKINCTSCHDMNEIHNKSISRNPDSDGKCFGCHKNGNAFQRYTVVAARHFNISPATGATYVTASNQNFCTSCHEPHNPLKGVGSKERKEWAESGHGDVTALAWTEDPFDARATCNACHTPTGFVKALTNGWTDTTAVNTGMQPLTCDGCHSSSDFKNSVRTISGGYKAGMGGFGTSAKAFIQYPDVNESNLCIPCHAGRENGQSIVKGVKDYTNQSFKNPHYLAAAAVFYGQGGFQFYSSASQTPYYPQAYTSKYGVIVDGTIIKAAAASTSNSTPAIAVGDVLVGEKAPWSHGKLGMNNFQTTKNAAVVAAKGDLVYSGTKGQCLSCHLGPENTHSFDAYNVAESTWVTGYKGCYGCHATNPVGGEDMKEVAELDEKPKFDASMAFFAYELQNAGLFYYADAYPYFYTALYDKNYTESGACASNLPVKNWQAGGTSTFTWDAANSSCASAAETIGIAGTGPARMGAAMNYKLLAAEKGAHVHNRTFMKQLIFDSIQHLQTGNVSFSNRYIVSDSTADPNGLINFSNYSTSLISTGKAGEITATVRGYITRKNTGTGTPAAIGSAATPLYTRP